MNGKQQNAVAVGLVMIALALGCQRGHDGSGEGLAGTWVLDVEETARYVALVMAGTRAQLLGDVNGYVDWHAGVVRGRYEQNPSTRIVYTFSDDGGWIYEVISEAPEEATRIAGTYSVEDGIVLLDWVVPVGVSSKESHVCTTAIWTGDRLYTLPRGPEYLGGAFTRVKQVQ